MAPVCFKWVATPSIATVAAVAPTANPIPAAGTRPLGPSPFDFPHESTGGALGGCGSERGAGPVRRGAGRETGRVGPPGEAPAEESARERASRASPAPPTAPPPPQIYAGDAVYDMYEEFAGKRRK